MYDLLCILDIMMPLREVMVALQSTTIAPWKAPLYMDRLIEHYERMQFRSMERTPMLAESYESLQNSRFQGMPKIQ